MQMPSSSSFSAETALYPSYSTVSLASDCLLLCLSQSTSQYVLCSGFHRTGDGCLPNVQGLQATQWCSVRRSLVSHRTRAPISSIVDVPI